MFPNADTARGAVIAELNKRGVSPTDLARQAKLDAGTVNDFLNGVRWPRPASLAKIERFLDWAPGTIENTARGYPTGAGGVSGAGHDDVSGVLLDIDESAYADLTHEERTEAITAAKLTYLERARAIRRARESD
ncbi:helix-turn-helix transcriptional regulator [Sanguibacter sp. 25GB23B1]|uniref:helix-turn-helix domain-containing protein n=1 Tax=unclassified Sanguibacter TaxID=2645534 RepID=UPI0032AFBF36